MNPKFICVKYDMEKGEGPELAKKKFGVRAYPTFCHSEYGWNRAS